MEDIKIQIKGHYFHIYHDMVERRHELPAVQDKISIYNFNM